MSQIHNRSTAVAQIVLMGGALLLCAAGCSRTYYRTKADKDVFGLVQQKAYDPRWGDQQFSIYPNSQARFFDPYDPDKEPLPPDDPTSHKLMHCVDGKKGSKKWHNNGDAPGVENPSWRRGLSLDAEGNLPLDLDCAIQVGRINSREYQRYREELYLSALDVSFERFRFDAQFFATNATYFTADGSARSTSNGESSSQLNTDTAIGFNKLYATGGEFAAGIANSLVWQFAGPDDYTPTTLLNFNLMQPLLRGAGRARVLERLTLSERTLLNNVRLMMRYQQGFYAQLVTGRDAVQGPTRRGGVFGGSGLEGFSGLGSGFGRVATTAIGAATTGVAGGAGAAQAGGYLGLLQQQLQNRNQQANVASLRDSLAQLEAAYRAARIDRFQVDLARQALYNAESRLLTSRAQYASSVDTYKLLLGLPPQLETKIDATFLQPFELIDRAYPPIQNDLARMQMNLGNAVDELRALAEQPGILQNAEFCRRLTELAAGTEQVLDVYRRTTEHYQTVQRDLAKLESNLDRRIRGVQRFHRKLRDRTDDVDGDGKADRPEAENVSVAAEMQELRRLPLELRDSYTRVTEALDESPAAFEKLRHELQWLAEHGAMATPADFRGRLGKLSGRAADPRIPDQNVQAEYLREVLGWMPDRLTILAGQVLELSLVQAQAKAEAVTLPVIELTAEEAIEIARENRLDWMNARAQLVDSWRLIEFNGNDLLSGLNVVFSGDISNVGNNAFDLRNKTGRLRVGMEFDSPITRLSERNNYRQALIDYQQARRDFMAFEDRIAQGLRNTVRTIQLNQVNFELRRAAIRVALASVEQARLRLSEPPKPGATSTFGATTARDLVNALADLLNVQNDFLSVWVNNEVQRIELELGLGTMQLDNRGMWVDPYQRLLQSQSELVPTPPAPEELPAPPPLARNTLRLPGKTSPVKMEKATARAAAQKPMPLPVVSEAKLVQYQDDVGEPVRRPLNITMWEESTDEPARPTTKPVASDGWRAVLPK